MTFDEAQEFCQSKKSKMVEIESEEENSVIIQELSKLSMQNRKGISILKPSMLATSQN